MAEDYTEENIEDEKEKKIASSRMSVWTEKFFSELLRLLIFSAVALVIVFLVDRQKGDSFGEDNFERIDRQFQNVVAPKPLGAEWEMDDMIINTADELENHFVKVNLVVSYDQKNIKISSALNARKSEIYSEVRKIIGSKLYVDLKSVKNQTLLAEELKTNIQRIIGMPGILEVYIVDFTIH